MGSLLKFSYLIENNARTFPFNCVLSCAVLVPDTVPLTIKFTFGIKLYLKVDSWRSLTPIVSLAPGSWGLIRSILASTGQWKMLLTLQYWNLGNWKYCSPQNDDGEDTQLSG